jgi:inorganic pyrophosphatase
MNMEYDTTFWEYLEKLIQNNDIIIDRPKGTRHPKYNNVIYPVDYGYIKDTKSMDNGGIDIFSGSEPNKKIDALICTIDLMKNDSEIKILLGCTKDEKSDIYNFLNNSDFMKAILVRRQ